MFDLVSFIPRAVVQSIPLLLGSTGETLTEKSGNLNLGIPGVMYVGGICGVIGAFLYEQSVASAAEMSGFLAIAIPMVSCLLGSLLMGLIYSLLTVTLRANQNVTGLALTTFGMGIANFFGVFVLDGSVSVKAEFANQAFKTPIPGLCRIPLIGDVLFSFKFSALRGVKEFIISYAVRRSFCTSSPQRPSPV